MDKRTSGKIASVALFVLGFIEVSGVVLLVLPQEFITSFRIQLPWELAFAAAMSTIFGLSRLVAGYAVWFVKKWGIVLGIILSTITLIIVPLVYQAGVIGIIDMLLAIIALVFMLYCWFGNEIIAVDKKETKN